MNTPNDENTPYDGKNQSGGSEPAPFGQEPPTGPIIYPEPPTPHYYGGNVGFATASLVLGIFALVSMCCFPPISLFFGALGLLFGLMSKGTHTRPGSAKTGMVLSSVGIAIVAGIIIFACSAMLSTESGRTFLREYVDIITNPEGHTQDDLYNILEKYLYENGMGNNSEYDDGTSPGGDIYDGLDEYQDDGELPYYTQPDDGKDFL